MMTRSLLLLPIAALAPLLVGACTDFDPLSDGILSGDAGIAFGENDAGTTPVAKSRDDAGAGPVGAPVQASDDDAGVCEGGARGCGLRDAGAATSPDTGTGAVTAADTGPPLKAAADAAVAEDASPPPSPPTWIVMTNDATACDGYLGVACGWTATNEGQGYTCQTTSWGTGCEPATDDGGSCGAPSGSYAQTCSNCELSGGTLTCGCLDTSGDTVTSSLDLWMRAAAQRREFERHARLLSRFMRALLGTADPRLGSATRVSRQGRR